MLRFFNSSISRSSLFLLLITGALKGLAGYLPPTLSLTYTAEAARHTSVFQKKGKVSFGASGGVAPYTYYVDNVVVSSPVNVNVAPGTHELRIVDADRQEARESVAIVQAAQWQHTYNVSVATDHSLNKTSTAATWGSSGAEAYNTLAAAENGWVDYVVPDRTQELVYGFSAQRNGAYLFEHVVYGVYLTRGEAYVVENGVLVSSLGRVANSDVIRMEKLGGQLYFYVNGTLYYDRVMDAVEDFFLKVSIKDADSGASGVFSTSFFNRPLVINAMVEHLSTDRLKDGLISVLASGGRKPYQFAGAAAGESASLANLKPGVYTFSVSDSLQDTLTRTVALGIQPVWKKRFNLNWTANAAPVVPETVKKGYAVNQALSYPGEANWVSLRVTGATQNLVFGFMGAGVNNLDTSVAPYQLPGAYVDAQVSALENVYDDALSGSLNYSSGALSLSGAQENIYVVQLQNLSLRILLNGAIDRSYALRVGDLVQVSREAGGALLVKVNGQSVGAALNGTGSRYLNVVYMQQSATAGVADVAFYTEAPVEVLAARLRLSGVCGSDACRRSVLTRTFDQNGNVVSESKQFTDNLGRATQSQQRVQSTGNVLGAEVIYDAFGRPAGQTLNAPMGTTNLCYNPLFFVNGAGQHFSSADFESTAPNGTGLAGSLGRYYSANNTAEPYVAADEYPYTKTEFSRDPLARPVKQAGIGVAHKAGSGRETMVFYENSANELFKVYQPSNASHYYTLYDNFNVAPYATAEANVVYKTIQRNADGHSLISYKNSAGWVLATCTTGDDGGCAPFWVNANLLPGHKVAMHLPKTQNATLKVTDVNQFAQYTPELYLYTTKQQLVQGVDYTWTSLSPTQKKATFMGAYAGRDLFLEIGGNWSSSTVPANPPVLSYQQSYVNWTLNYYDVYGRLKAVQSPNDVTCAGSNGGASFVVAGQSGSTPLGCEGGGNAASINLNRPAGFNPDLQIKRAVVEFNPVFVPFDTVALATLPGSYVLQTNAALGLADSSVYPGGVIPVFPISDTVAYNNAQQYERQHARKYLSGKRVRYTGTLVPGLRDATGAVTWYNAKSKAFTYRLDLNGNDSRFVNLAEPGAGLLMNLDSLSFGNAEQVVFKTSNLQVQLEGFEGAPQLAFNPCQNTYYVPAFMAQLLNAINANVQLNASAQFMAVPPNPNPPVPVYSKRYSYNEYGHLIASESQEEGKTEFLYDAEGKLMFSQNAAQKANGGKYSYVVYDFAGRVQESGEYDPSINDPNYAPFYFQNYTDIKNGVAVPAGYVSIGTQINNVLNNIMPLNPRNREQTWLSYDAPDAGYPVAGSQQYVNGRLSKSRNAHSTTWYSYNSRGELVKAIQNVLGLGVKQTDYTYDYFGSVNVVQYQAGSATEVFRSTFNTDADGRPYTAAYQRGNNSMISGTTGTYRYYPHGALKRVETGSQPYGANQLIPLQGQDYVYTIGGLLKSVNNPGNLGQGNGTGDPGNDGGSGSISNADVFGYILDYYPGDYTRTGTGGLNAGTQPGNPYGPFNISYTGQISSQRWQRLYAATQPQPQSTDPQQYHYDYDAQYRLSGASNGHYVLQAAPGGPLVPYQVNYTPADYYKLSNISYDKNGNIQSLKRWGKTAGNTPTLIDDLSYIYGGGSQQNTLKQVHDAVTTSSGLTAEMDLPDQSNAANYRYNAIGQLTLNLQENQQYSYYSNGLIKEIRNPVNHLLLSNFTYNDKGLRNSKTTYNSSGQLLSTQYYIYEAGGGLLATYEQTLGQSSPIIKEYVLYGAGGERAGMLEASSNTAYYELSDHLGNVRTVITAKAGTQGGVDIVEAGDYYPHGGILPGTRYVAGGSMYRYGYQGQERDAESGLTNFELRQYDPRLGRWNNPDPYGQHHSPYLAMSNNPVNSVDPDGGWDFIIDGISVSEHMYNTFTGHSSAGFDISYGNLAYGTLLGYAYGDNDFYGKYALENAQGAQVADWKKHGIIEMQSGDYGQIFNNSEISNKGNMRGSCGIVDVTDAVNAILREQDMENHYVGSAQSAWRRGNYTEWMEYKLKRMVGEDFDRRMEKAAQPYMEAIAKVNPLVNLADLVHGIATGKDIFEHEMSGSDYAMSGLGIIGLGDLKALNASKPLYHYTTEAGYAGIMESKLLNPSIVKRYAHHGPGQYFTDIAPGTFSAKSVSYKLYGHEKNVYRLTHCIKVETSGLQIIKNHAYNFLHPSNTPLDISNRILWSGKTGY